MIRGCICWRRLWCWVGCWRLVCRRRWLISEGVRDGPWRDLLPRPCVGAQWSDQLNAGYVRLRRILANYCRGREAVVGHFPPLAGASRSHLSGRSKAGSGRPPCIHPETQSHCVRDWLRCWRLVERTRIQPTTNKTIRCRCCGREAWAPIQSNVPSIRRS